MGLDLIVCEKPSAAKSFASALGARWSGPFGAYEAPGVRIVAMHGHLLGLRGLRESDTRFQGQWNAETLRLLPVFPNLQKSDMYEEKDKKLITVLRKRLNDPAITRVINATDPGREGELLFWELYDYCGATKPVFRFWESQALSKEVVLRGLMNLRSADFYAPRKAAAYARQQADWLMGMNLSVAYTSVAGSTFSVGPVQTPTLAMIVNRDELISCWSTLPYMELTIYPEGFTAKYRPSIPKFEDRPYSMSIEDADEYVAALRDVKTVTVKSVNRETSKVLPPKLFSLTELQISASKKYDFSASKTLKIAQKLYDDEDYKCLSYPRTDSEVIGDTMTDEVSRIAEKLSKHYQIPHTVLQFTSRNVNNEELTDHHAILPLKPLPTQASEDEQKIYELVLRRFFEAFGPDGIDQRTVVTLNIGELIFEATGRIPVDLGWRSVRGEVVESGDELDRDDAPVEPALFRLTERQVLRLTKPMTLERKKLEPPNPYTVSTLLKAMKNIANSVEDKKVRKLLIETKAGLGTPATRAGIIDLLLKRGYIEKKGRRLVSTMLGRSLIASVLPELRNYQQRAKMEELLNDYENASSHRSYIEDTKRLIEKGVDHAKGLRPEEVLPAIGVQCPDCQSDLVEKSRAYACKSCAFTLPRTWGGYTLTMKDIQSLTTSGLTDVHTFNSQKTKSTFPARVKLEDGKLIYVFPTKEELALGDCPKCGGGKVIPQTSKVVACMSCDFYLFRTIAGVTLTDAQLKKLLKDKHIPKIKGFKKRDKQGNVEIFIAGLAINSEGKVEFSRVV